MRQITELEGYFKKSCWIRISANRLSYALNLRGEKNQWKYGILLKMDIHSEDDTFDSNKPGNFNSIKRYFLL